MKLVTELTRRDIAIIYDVPPWLIAGGDRGWRERLWWHTSPRRWHRKIKGWRLR